MIKSFFLKVRRMMGVNQLSLKSRSLLRNMGEIESKRHARHFKGLLVAVDGFCWLHKAVYTSKRDFARAMGSTRSSNK